LQENIVFLIAEAGHHVTRAQKHPVKFLRVYKQD